MYPGYLCHKETPFSTQMLHIDTNISMYATQEILGKHNHWQEKFEDLNEDYELQLRADIV